MASLTVYRKEGRAWNPVLMTEDDGPIYRSLTENLIAKKINECKYIRRIERRNNYDGTQTITVYFDRSKSVYVIDN